MLHKQKYLARLSAIWILCFVSVLASCDAMSKCRDLKFEALSEANRMRISTNHDKTLRETTNPEEIQELLRFVSVRTVKWCQPWYGTPIGKVRANLYKDGEYLGAISLGPNFMGAGMWFIRRISAGERRELLRIFNVPDPYKP